MSLTSVANARAVTGYDLNREQVRGTRVLSPSPASSTYTPPKINLQYFQDLISRRKKGEVKGAELEFNPGFDSELRARANLEIHGIIVVEDNEECMIPAFRRSFQGLFDNIKREVEFIDPQYVEGEHIEQSEEYLFPILFVSKPADYSRVASLAQANSGLISMIILDVQLSGDRIGGRRIAKQLRDIRYPGWVFYCSAYPDEQGLDLVHLHVDKGYLLTEFIGNKFLV